MQLIKLTEIQANPHQPRKHFDEQALVELSQSIKVEGIMSPIMVRPIEGKYEIVQGERRFRAAQMAGLIEIPSIVREVDEQEAFHLAVIENIQREQMTPIEEAQAFMKYVEIGFTHEQIAQKVSKSRTYVTTKLRMLHLPQEIQDWISSGKLAEGHAKRLLSAKNDVCRLMEMCYFSHGTEDSFSYFTRIFMYTFKDADKISVKQVERFCRRWKYLMIKSELNWLVFLAMPQEIKDDDFYLRLGLESVGMVLETGFSYENLTLADINDAFQYFLEYKSPETKAWVIYKLMEDWENVLANVNFKEIEYDDLVEVVRSSNSLSDLII